MDYFLEIAMNSVTKISMALCVVLPLFTHAGESAVKWHDFKDYRDVRASNQTKASYHKQITKQFEKHFSKLAEQLPKDYKLNVEITDVDLAGDVRFSGTSEIRVVEPIFFPRINLNYSLVNKEGDVISEANDVELKDMGFMDRIRRGREESFDHEERLLTQWFGEQVLTSID